VFGKMKSRVHNNQLFRHKTVSGYLLIACLLFPLSAGAQAVQDNITELRKIDIIEHLGDTIDLNLRFTDDNGREIQLGQFFHQGEPVVLVLGYYECPMLCNLVFNGLSAGVQQLEWKPGTDFQMLTVSINPRDNYQLAHAKRINYLADMGATGVDPGWMFLVGDESQSQELADEIGFKYYYDRSNKQYAHPAAVYILTEDGRISRYLYGIEFKPQDLRLSLLEASEGRIGNTIDRLILYCFHYDPEAKGYVLFAGNVMRLGGVVTLIVLGGLLIVLWRKEQNRRRLITTASSRTLHSQNMRNTDL